MALMDLAQGYVDDWQAQQYQPPAEIQPWDDRAPTAATPTAPNTGTLATQYQGQIASGERDAADLPVANMIDRDWDDWQNELKQGASAIEQQYGLSSGSLYNPTDLRSVISNISYARNAGRDPREFINQTLDQYRVRGASGGARESGGYDTNLPDLSPEQLRAGQSQPSSGSRGSGINVPGQFTDPIQSYLEQFARMRAEALEKPPGGSGQNLFEDALRRISEQFGSGGYTNAQQEILNTQAIEPIEQLRQQRKQQVLVQLSQRGIDPNSGVGRQMLQDVDRQFDAAKIQQSRALANQAVNEQQQRLMTSINLLAQLAGTENQRLDQSYQYRTVPYNLGQQAFQNAMGLYGQAGNPLSLVNPLLSLANSQQSRSDQQGAALADLVWALTRGS